MFNPTMIRYALGFNFVEKDMHIAVTTDCAILKVGSFQHCTLYPGQTSFLLCDTVLCNSINKYALIPGGGELSFHYKKVAYIEAIFVV